MIRLQILLIFIIFTFGCENSSNNKLLKQWKADRIGCDSLRLNIVNQDFKNFENAVLGKSENYILVKLGEPNERFNKGQTEVLTYFVEPGIQCIDKSSKEIDVLRLTLELQNDIVQSIGKILP